MKKMRKFLIGGIAAASLCLIGFGVNSTDVNAVAEDKTLNGFQAAGASVRLKKADENDPTGDGIRFTMIMEKTVYNTVSAKADFVSGTLLIPETYAPAGTEELYATTANVKNTVTTTHWVEYTEDTGYMASAVYLWGIPATEYDSDILARGYVSYDGETYYTDTIARSIAYVARAALEDTTTDYSGYEDTLESYVPKYNVAVVDEDGETITAAQQYRYGDTFTYTHEDSTSVARVYVGDQEIVGTDNVFTTKIVSGENIVVKTYTAIATKAEFLAHDFETKNAILTDDIDLGTLTLTNYGKIATGSSINLYAVIEKLDKELDGNGKNLTFNYRAADNYGSGLFAFINGTVKNLNVNATVRFRVRTGSFAFQGNESSVFENCRFNIVATSDTYDGGSQNGAVMAFFSGTMRNCIVAFDHSTLVNAIAHYPANLKVEGGMVYGKEAAFENVLIFSSAEQIVYYSHTASQIVGVTACQITLSATELTLKAGEAAQTVSVSVESGAEISYAWTTEKNGVLSLENADTATVSVSALQGGADTLYCTVTVNGFDVVYSVSVDVWNAITTVDELKAMDGQTGKYFLANDLTITHSDLVGVANDQGVASTVYLGVMSNMCGTLDGNGKTITFTSETTGVHRMLIRYLNGYIYNLNMVANIKDGGTHQEGLLAFNFNAGAVVEDCTFNVTVDPTAYSATGTGEVTYSPNNFGTIFNMMNGTLKNSTITFSVVNSRHEVVATDETEGTYYYAAIAVTASNTAVCTGVTVITDKDRQLFTTNNILAENLSVTQQTPATDGE